LRIVDRFKKAELAVASLNARSSGDRPGRRCGHIAAALRGDEELDFGMLEVGVLGGVRCSIALEIERRHPMGIVLVDGEGTSRRRGDLVSSDGRTVTGLVMGVRLTSLALGLQGSNNVAMVKHLAFKFLNKRYSAYHRQTGG